jgi:hypothetical protein
VCPILLPVSPYSCYSFSRVDLHRGDLIVGCRIGFGHEIMTALFVNLERKGGSYPSQYNTREIYTFGQANVDLVEGSKSPDYTLYDLGKDDGDSDTAITPTIAWEIGYAENEKKLEMDAARLICLTEGLVLLVVTVKISHEPNVYPKKLKRVVWQHWELDSTQLKPVDNEMEKHQLNDPKPLLGDNQTLPPSYEAYVKFDEEVYRFVARVTKTFEV